MTEPPHHNHNPSPMVLSAIETAPQPSTTRKKRNLPGMPDPDAEVVALSPKTLLATNPFVCEICNKGFQRDQNLQLHRRGHNLPWKLRQRDTTEVRKKVYVCPDPTCVHHNPARALGDLTGIKKHFWRKHGEKKLKCERCSKKYAVKSDWNAHMKTCGTREYRCACGTLFSRRDSFVTHRAFCDALAEESARTQTQTQTLVTGKNDVTASPSPSPPPPPLTPSTSVVSPTLSIQSSEIIAENAARQSPPPPTATCMVNAAATVTPSSSTTCGNFFASLLASAAVPNSTFPNLTAAIAAIEPTSLTLSSPLYLSSNNPPLQDPHHHRQYYATAALSATALLQKAVQMGASASNASSFLRGFGLSSSSSSPTGQDDSINDPTQWSRHVKQEKNLSTLADHNLGLGLPCGNNAAGFADLMMGSPPGPSPFGGRNQPMMTRDLLGLGIGGNGGASKGDLSSLLTSFGGGSFDSAGDGGV